MSLNFSITYHRSFPRNNFGEDFFVGDLHGSLHELNRLLKQIEFNFSKDRLFCTGDLIDRGENSQECLELLNTNWFFSVLGNHELFLIESQEKNYFKEAIWKRNGGSWFYSISPKMQNKLRKLVLDKVSLSLSVETDSGVIGVVHSEYPYAKWPIREDSTINDEVLRQLVWNRLNMNEQSSQIIEGVNLLISGHSSVQQPLLIGKQLYIDTGAGYKPNVDIKAPRLTICKVCDSQVQLYAYRRNTELLAF
ncbi:MULTISPECIES: metallophosphoesterase [Pseudoalteromonas]|uniref:Calcineurin-like phosphoesterase domain-containing protein n=1 Tax=Pseudoalteromonas amylolytica TaxID=1859457 RepID=A0A1S1MVS8_9GAMM|nr:MULTISPECIES: metallophosphoesterase [Pseudoalteromonas]OHU85154.1 hypothetical protein BFC16_21010 [Pseudoalteromonas sp. JW3]OHU89895.1 hypothetical protein BET10_13965 [Pseudoalteromonas amylolytica]